MKKVILFITFFLISISPVYMENISEYNILRIKTVKAGKKAGEIGVDYIPEGIVGPLTFFINKQNEFYVPDPVNNRLNIYDASLNFIQTIIEKQDGRMQWAQYLVVDTSGNIIYLNDYFGLRKVDKQGNEIFTIRSSKLNKQIINFENLFIIENDIFFYNDNNELGIITQFGAKEKKEKVLKKLQIINNNANDLEPSESIKLSKNILQSINKLQSEGKHLIVGNKFYSSSFSKNQEYYKIINVENNPLKSKGNIKTDLQKMINSAMFAGYDNEHNIVWACTGFKESNIRKEFILIYSKFGKLLDAFYYGQITGYEYDTKVYPTSGANVAVAPDGDVWFLVGSLEKYDFYKVDRQW